MRIHRHLPALAVLVLCVSATLVVVWQLDRVLTSKDQERFSNAAERLEDAIDGRIATYLDMLRATAGMVNFEDAFHAGRFRTYVRELDIQSRYPGIQGVGFTQRILPSALEAVTAERRAVQPPDLPPFRVWPDDARDEYHAILALEPLDERNRVAIGYDMFTDATRRAAMERARDTGQPAASGPVVLVQEIDEEKQPGFLIYFPVYRGGAVPDTVAGRRERLRGFVYSPFRAHDLFDGILSSERVPRAGFSLADAASPSMRLYQTGQADEGALTTERQISVAGRVWSANMFSLPGLGAGSYTPLLPGILITGIALSTVLAGLVALQTAARVRLEQSERASHEARAEAERISGMKDEFLATLSHELRTPLNAVLGWTHMLRAGTVPEVRTHQVLDTIERNAMAQSRLIDDLLDMSRIISGRLRMDTTEVQLPELLDAALAIVRPAADAKGVTLHRTYQPVPPVTADPGRLQQIFWNLLANAVKFTPRGGRVDVYLREREAQVEIEVRDTGIGISEAFLPWIFDRFRQADVSTRREYGGLGLGLSIVQSLVHLHGGTIHAHSEGTGRGATFTVRLPLAVVPATASRVRRA